MSIANGMPVPPEDLAPRPRPDDAYWEAAVQARAEALAAAPSAGFWIRATAWIIDCIILGILVSAGAPFVGSPPIAGSDGVHLGIDSTVSVFNLVAALVYFVGQWSYRGRTLGMIPFGLWVVRARDGGRLDVVEALLRYVGLIASFAILLLGVIWVALDPRKQGWHDKLAGSLVVRP